MTLTVKVILIKVPLPLKFRLNWNSLGGDQLQLTMGLTMLTELGQSFSVRNFWILGLLRKHIPNENALLQPSLMTMIIHKNCGA